MASCQRLSRLSHCNRTTRPRHQLAVRLPPAAVARDPHRLCYHPLLPRREHVACVAAAQSRAGNLVSPRYAICRGACHIDSDVAAEELKS